jgi:pyrroline-5-carboxylate reductase
MNNSKRPRELGRQTIGFIGVGNMAEALIRGLLDKQVLPATQIIANDIRPGRLAELHQKFGIRTDNASEADIIIFAVKPQQMSAALSTLHAQPSKLFISVAAGITTDRIERALGGQPHVVRVMPNTPALVGAGAAALAKGRYATDDDLATAETIMNAVGITARVAEDQLDAVTALSGSGPAYVFYVTEAMTQAGVAQGLPAELAHKLAVQTVAGAGKLMTETGDEPGKLREKVTSPGGTTEAALKVMSERKLMEIFNDAIAAATKRGWELSRE